MKCSQASRPWLVSINISNFQAPVHFINVRLGLLNFWLRTSDIAIVDYLSFFVPYTVLRLTWIIDWLIENLLSSYIGKNLVMDFFSLELFLWSCTINITNIERVSLCKFTLYFRLCSINIITIHLIPYES